ncbi:MAG TPA: hypothetical protein PKD64_17215 [Pirellulaceae bacterium]|nr:hypothetical protein [Pirellulaceae bacterium]HMO93928.1 hypothetical protein [Pirellulaceae bacterium]HMP69761.1 hypothetical protein [Pirellulaceae bacterium]
MHSLALSGSREALAITKSHWHAMSRVDVVGQLQQSMSISVHARETADAREGFNAFLEKRKPVWQPSG